MDPFSLVAIAKVFEEDVEENGVSFLGCAGNWTTEVEVQNVIKKIEECDRLNYLNLEGNTLGVPAARAIGIALEKHPEFKKAQWRDLFTGRLKNEIPEALEYMSRGIIIANAHLTVLDCSDNALGPNGMVGLVGFLRSPSCYSLQELRLNNCGLGVTGGKMLAEALSDCYLKSVIMGTPLTLKVFEAGRNRLENGGTKALASFFEEVKTLTEVSMPQNGIYPPGIKALSLAFKENPNMQVLNLNDNTIRWKGAQSLAAVFNAMPRLREINFGDCLLRNRGAIFLSEALSENHLELEVLKFDFNEIGPDGGLVVINALRNKSMLQTIYMGGNQFGQETCERMWKIIDEDNSETTLHLTDDESDAESESDSEEIDSEVDGGETSENGDMINVSNQSLDSTIEGSYVSNSSIICDTEEEHPNTIETFCKTLHPTKAMFELLEESDKVEAFRKYFTKNERNDYLTQLVYTILKCSELAEESAEACEVAKALYKDAFDYAQTTNQLNRVRTFFLTQLDLLKCEDKTFKIDYNVAACRTTLKQAIENKAFPSEIENTFKVFLERAV